MAHLSEIYLQTPNVRAAGPTALGLRETKHFIFVPEKLNFMFLFTNFSFDAGTGYYSDEDYERPKQNVTMAAFRDVVKNSLEKLDSSTVVNINRPNPPGSSFSCNQVDVDQHSGLRIRCD